MLGGGTGGAQAVATDFGGGEGTIAFGRAVVAGSEKLMQIRQRRENQDVQLFAAQAEMEWIERMDEMRTNADPTGDNYVENFRGEFERFNEQTMEQYDHLGPDARNLLERNLLDIRTRNTRYALRDQAEIRGAYQTNQIEELQDGAVIGITNNPERYGDIRQSVIGAIDGLGIEDENKRVELMRDVETGLASSYVSSLLTNANSAAQVEQIMSAVAEDEEMSSRLTGSDFSALQSEAETRGRQIRTEQRASAALASSMMANVRAGMVSGIAPDEQTVQALEQSLNSAGAEGARVRADWIELQNLQEVTQQMRMLPPDELRDMIDNTLAPGLEDGASGYEFDVYQAAMDIAGDNTAAANAQQTAINEAATAAWRGYEALLTSGVSDPDPELLAQLAELGGRADNAAGASLRDSLAAFDIQEQIGDQSPLDLSRIAEQTVAGGINTPTEQLVYDTAVEMYNELTADLASDPLGAAVTRGVVTLTPIDPSDPTSIRSRAIDIAYTREHYNVEDVDFFRPDEVDSMTVWLADAPVAQQLALAQQVVGAGGSMEQFSSVAPGITVAGNMISYNPRSADAAREVLQASNLVSQTPASELIDATSMTMIRTGIAGIASNFTHMRDDTFSSLSDALINVTAMRMVNSGMGYGTAASDTAAQRTFNQTLDTVFGATTQNGVKTGGWSTEMGGFPVPRGVTEDDVLDVINDATPEELQILTGGTRVEYGMAYSLGEGVEAPAFSLSDIGDVNLIIAPGQDQYYVLDAMGNYMADATGQHVAIDLSQSTIQRVLGGR
jgi:hypothetical protein